ncbi:MAG TPA: IS66 family transposase [Archangium sp.]
MLTREEFQRIYDAGPDATYAFVCDLLARLDVYERRLGEVEARLAKRSHNSDKPPASDGLARPARSPQRSLRERSGRSPGAQPGHRGHTLRRVKEPDERVSHVPSACACCGHSLQGGTPCGEERRQVFDLPKRLLHVVEHVGQSLQCPHCQHVTAACFPDGVGKPVQYGPGVLGLGVYLQAYQLLPFARTRELFRVLFGQAPAAGTLERALRETHTALEGAETAIRDALLRAAAVHLDETGVRVEGHTRWLHVASTPEHTLLRVQASRGGTAIDEIGIVAAMQGVRVHDALPAYVRYGGRFALCNAHLMRELIALAETTHQPWTLALLALLRQMKTAADQARSQNSPAVPLEVRASLERRYEALLAEGDAANPEPPQPARQRGGRPGGRLRRSPAQNLLLRLHRHRDAVLYFLRDLDVPFDNNQAERDLRMAKVQQKISGGFRSAQGADVFARIRSYISTLRKQGAPLLPALSAALQGATLLPA